MATLGFGLQAQHQKQTISSAPLKTPNKAKQACERDLSESVNISEVFPNPEGSDQESEWIEITNTSSVDVNLGNWIIDDGKNHMFFLTTP